jgi:hypothetical protein
VPFVCKAAQAASTIAPFRYRLAGFVRESLRFPADSSLPGHIPRARFPGPVTQGLEIYGVLTAKEVPARLVVYPDENHWVLKGSNAKHWYGEVLGWLAGWFK